MTASTNHAVQSVEATAAIENRAHLPAEEFKHLAQTLAAHRSIKHALDWWSGRVPPLTISEMVTQDEFSHDIIVQYSEDLHLVYDVS